MPSFDFNAIRNQFPILDQQVNGKPLIYFDNAATSQKPQAVIDAIVEYYHHDNANVHRGLHELSERATAGYENAREQIAQFINAPKTSEVVYTSGATEAINIVAQCFVAQQLSPSDAVLITEMEHHSNIVPWQILQKKYGLTIRWLPVNTEGELEIDKLPQLLADGRVKFASLNWTSNSLGTINPVKQLIETLHAHEVPVLLDACQVPAHQIIDVQQLDCDFLAFSGHKMFAPTGIGVLWGKTQYLENFELWQGGGDMILEVGFEDFTPNQLPNRLEAGTPAIAQTLGFAAAINWLADIDLNKAYQHEQNLLLEATQGLMQIPHIKLVGTAKQKTAVISFCMENNTLHPSDLATLLNLSGVAVRSGHHCTMPILKKMGVPATVRASFSFYNSLDEVKSFIVELTKIVEKYS